MSNAPLQLLDSLADFTGTESLHRWSPLFPRDLMTDGFKYLCDKGGAYWLADLVASHQTNPALKKEDFQLWQIMLNENTRGALVSSDDGNGNALTSQTIQYTDFPLPLLSFYACRNEYGGITLMLRSEY